MMYENSVMCTVGSSKYSFKKHSGAGGPKWTMTELAESFGLTVQQLNGCRRIFDGFPEPAITAGPSSVASKRVYYDKKAATAWYKTNEQAIKQHMKESA